MNSVIIFAALLNSCICLLIIMLQKPSHEQIFVQSLINAGSFLLVGYLIYYYARTEDMLIVGTKLQYIGGCGMYLLIFLICSKVYQLHVPKPAWVVVIVWTAFLAVLTLTFNYHHWYYRSYHVAVRNGSGFLVTKNAWGHTAFIVTLTVYAALFIFFFIWKLLKDKKKEKTDTVSFFVIVMLPQVCYFISLFMNTDGHGFPWLPAALLISEIVGTYFVVTQRFCSLNELAFFTIFDSMDHPLFIYDSRFYLRSLNHKAKELFPEYKCFKTDVTSVKVPDELKKVSGSASLCSGITADGQPQYVDINGRNYIPECHPVQIKDRMYGYVACLNDMTEHRNKCLELEGSNKYLKLDIRLKADKLLLMQEKMIFGFATLLENKNFSTGGHVRRTSNFVFVIAQELQLEGKYPDILKSNDYIETLRQVAPLHDIGKIGIPESILDKPGRLTPEEFEIMKTHVVTGAGFIEKLSSTFDDLYYRLAHEVALYHHERWNGSGYVHGLKGLEIPLSARIMSVADVFDALSSSRPYKEVVSLDEAFSTIRASSGLCFDPVVVDAFLAARPLIESMYLQIRRDGKTPVEEL